MKEFEKWWAKEMAPRVLKGEVIFKNDCFKAWKAAKIFYKKMENKNEPNKMLRISSHPWKDGKRCN